MFQFSAPPPEVKPYGLEEELKDIFGWGPAARITIRRYGFDGRGGVSLRQLARETGLSYESIRQISGRLVIDRTAACLETPVLDRVVDFIAGQAPTSAEGIERLLSMGTRRRRAFRL